MPKIQLKDKYIFIYTVALSNKVNFFINQINTIYKYKIFWVKENIRDFIYGIYYSKAIITDSFHGTIFSIIFNKPFIAFLNEGTGVERFISLKGIFDIGNRLYDIQSNKTIPNISLLEKPLNLNMKIYHSLKRKSIKYLKKNLKGSRFFKL